MVDVLKPENKYVVFPARFAGVGAQVLLYPLSIAALPLEVVSLLANSVLVRVDCSPPLLIFCVCHVITLSGVSISKNLISGQLLLLPISNVG